MPKQIQPLCVSVLGNRQEDFDNLIGAVSEITSKYNSWDKERNRERIIRLEQELSKLRQVLQTLKISLRELREKETYKHSIVGGKYTGTAQEIAQQLKEKENIYGWIPDEISESEPCPISQVEFLRLLELYRQFNSSRCKELLLKRVKTSVIFSPEAFVEMVENEQKFKESEINIEKDIDWCLLYEKLRRVDSMKRKKLLEALRTLEKVKIEACRRPLFWLKEAVYSILGDQDLPLKDLRSITQKYLEGLKDKTILADDCNISITIFTWISDAVRIGCRRVRINFLHSTTQLIAISYKNSLIN